MFYSDSITKILNIEYPIIQGGMAWIADSNLAAAVSMAGGLGLIASGAAPVDWIREQIRQVRVKTDKPFGVNIMLMNPECDDIAKMLCEEKVPIITTGAGSPGKYMEAWKAYGAKVIPVVPNCALALRMQRMGADAVVAEGCEAGGHIGTMNTMALIPQVVDALDIPVIAAGGIADGRGMAAAFMLGAKGVQMGTKFLVANECNIHENYKNKVISAKDTDTVITGTSTGHPVRQIKNIFAKNLLELEKNNLSPEEFEKLGAGSLKKAAVEGDKDAGAFMAGQISGLVKEKQSVSEIIHEIIDDAQKIINEFAGR